MSAKWVGKGQPLSLTGDSGTGKSHLLIGLGAEAAMNGYRVRYVLAAKLVNELVEAADERQLTKTIARYGRVDLLCIDDSDTWNSTGAAPSCCSRSSPGERKATASRFASNESFGKSHMFAGTCVR